LVNKLKRKHGVKRGLRNSPGGSTTAKKKWGKIWEPLYLLFERTVLRNFLDTSSRLKSAFPVGKGTVAFKKGVNHIVGGECLGSMNDD